MSGSAVADTERPEQTTEIEIEVPAPRRIEIIGYTESRKDAHWGDPSWERWLCNDLYRFCPDDWHRVYDIHAIADIKADANHDAFLKGGSRPLEDGGKKQVALDGRPVYIMKDNPEWPTAVPFPKDECIDAFGDYFTNSISWMVAHAMLEIRDSARLTADIKTEAAAKYAKETGTEKFFEQTRIGLHAAFMHDYEAQCAIHIYGVDMATGTEYCVSPDTPVLTADLRWIPAADVVSGDRLVGFDEDCSPADGGRYRKWRTAIVESAETITRPCYRVKLDDGAELVSSQEHRWLCHKNGRTGWVETRNLRADGMPVETRELIRAEYAMATAEAGARTAKNKTTDITSLAERHNTSFSTVQRIVNGRANKPMPPTRIVKPFDTWVEDRSYGAGFLAAAFDGEGHVSANARGLGFAQRPNAMAAAVERELDARGFDFASTLGKCGTKKYEVKGGRRAVVRFLGMMRPPRLLAKLSAPDAWGSFFGTMSAPSVTQTDYIGEQPVVALKTTTGTFIADGFASHNSGQRPSVEFILGIAEGRGIQTHVPLSSDLLKTGAMYGAESDSAMRAKFIERRDELNKRGQHLQQTIAQAQTQLAQIQGALETTNYVIDVWCNPHASRDGSAKDQTTAPPSEAQLQEAA